MMGQQKRPPEVAASPQFVKYVKPFTSSRCKEASKWLEANSETMEEDNEQLSLKYSDNRGSCQFSKEPTLQDELLFLQTRKVRALNISQVANRSKSSIDRSEIASPLARVQPHNSDTSLKECIHTTRPYNFETNAPKNVAFQEMMEIDPDSGTASSETRVKTISNLPNSTCRLGNLSEVGTGEKSKSMKEVEIRHDDLRRMENEEIPDMARSSFLKLIQKALQVRNMNMSRPLPVMVDSKEVDLFLLSRKVKDAGGYLKVTEASSWRKISEEMGFGSNCGPCLKLVYVKYLRLLETGKIFGPTVFEDILLNQEISSSRALNGEISGVTVLERQQAPPGNTFEEMLNMAAEHNSTPKSKQDPLVSALQWIKRLASNPGDPNRGQGPRLFQKNELWVQYYATLAGNMRNCLCKGEKVYPMDLTEHAWMHQ